MTIRSNLCATAFRFNPSDPAGTFATIWASGGPGGPGCYVGEGGLVGAADGNLYFLTSDGGPCGSGRIFRLTPPGTVAPLVDFFGWRDRRRGFRNLGNGLTVGADGALYGVALAGGTNSTGGLYRVGLDGALSAVVSFPAGQSGQRDALTLGTDGRLYGTAANFFSASFIYRFDPQSGLVGKPSTSFPGRRRPEWLLPARPPAGGAAGRRPAQDIAFVGVTPRGDTYGAGVVYRLDLAGSHPDVLQAPRIRRVAADLSRRNTGGRSDARR